MKTDWLVKDKSKRASYENLTKFGKGVIHVADTVFGVIRGFADWIGMGDKVTSWIDKGTGMIDVNKVRADLSSKVQDLLDKNEIDLSDLESRLSKLESMGFVLTGEARHRLSQSIAQTKGKVTNQKLKNRVANAKAALIQNDIDTKLKNYTESGDLQTVLDFKDVQDKVEKEIGELNHV